MKAFMDICLLDMEKTEKAELMAARAAQESKEVNDIDNANTANKKARQELVDVNTRLKDKRLTGHLSSLLQ